MAEFGIAPEKAKRHTEEFDRYSDLLADYADRTMNIGTSLNQLGGSTERVRAALRAASAQIGNERQAAKDLSTKLMEIITLYEMTEKRICDQTGSSMASQSPKDVESDKADADILDEAGDGSAWDYFLDALKQALLGDFTDDANLLGTVLSVVIGFVPVVGTVADFRDLVADIYNLIDDGPTTEEWVSLGFTLVGIIPGIGDVFKHGDEIGDTVKGILKNLDCADEVSDTLKAFLRKGDDIVSAVGNKVDDFNDFFKHHVWDKVDDLIDSHSAGRAVKDTMSHITDTVKNSDVYKGVDQLLDKLDYTKGKFEISAKEFIKNMVDEYKGNFEESVLTDLLEMIGGEPQAEPAV